jgi:hypothetical protein
MSDLLMDNDVVHKIVAYGLFDQLLEAIPEGTESIGVLGSARFVIAKLLKKRPPQRGAAIAITDLNAALERLTEVEPGEAELQAAAQLQFEAQRLNVPLDSGEALLCAILIYRGLSLLLTGDKRAINAIETLVYQSAINPTEVATKLVCLEEVVRWLLRVGDPTKIRRAVCQEHDVDKALNNCFSCSSPEVGMESWHAGLESYIQALRQTAPTVIFSEST